MWSTLSKCQTVVSVVKFKVTQFPKFLLCRGLNQKHITKRGFILILMSDKFYLADIWPLHCKHETKESWLHPFGSNSTQNNRQLVKVLAEHVYTYTSSPLHSDRNSTENGEQEQLRVHIEYVHRGRALVQELSFVPAYLCEPYLGLLYSAKNKDILH